MNLKIKITFLVLGLLSVSVGGLAAVLIWSQTRALSHEMAQRQTALAEGLAEVCRNALFSEQDLPLTNYLRKLAETPGVLEAYCVDAAGVIAGHTRRELTKKPWEGPFDHASAPARAEEGGRLEVSAPAVLGDRSFGTARVVFSAERAERELREEAGRARRRIAGMALPVLAAGALLAFVLTAIMLRPVESLVRGARAIGGGDLSHKIPARGKDEVALLAAEFNRMGEKLQELDRMKQDFVSGVTHDLKSPLAAARTAAEMAQAQVERDVPDGALRGSLAEKFLVIRESADRLSNLVTSILEVARIESGLVLGREAVRLEELVQRAAAGFHLLAERKGLSFDVVVHRSLAPVSVDAGKMERVLANLVGNAVKFTAKGGVKVELDGGDGFQTVRVSDTGPGIPPEARERLFSKFFRVRRPGESAEGTGLGLSIAKGIAEAHGGTLTAEERPGGGAVFVLRLPVKTP